MSFDVIVALATNIILLMSLSVIYALFTNESKQSYIKSKLIMGLSVSISGFIIMYNSVEIEPGIFFDGRSILMLLTGMYFGIIPVIMGSISLSAYRIFLGGDGTIPGVLWVLIPAVVGTCWRYFRLKNKNRDLQEISPAEQYILLFITQTLVVVILFLFPNKVSLQAINTVALPLVLIHPFGGLVVSMFMLRQRKLYLQGILVQEREKEYNELFHSSSNYSFIVNKENGNIINVNTSAIEKYGFTDTEFRAMTIYDLSVLPKEEILKNEEKVKTNNLDYFITKHVLKNNEIIDVEIRCALIKINGVEYSYQTITDVTNRIKNQKEFENTNIRLTETLHSVTEGVIVTDEYGNIEIINEVAEHYLQTKSDSIGKKIVTIVRIYNKNQDDDFSSIFSNVSSTNTPYKSQSPYILLSNDIDEKTYIHFSLSPIRDKDNIINGFIFVFRDVTNDYIKRNQIEYVSQHDFLTGLYNRYFMEAELKRLDTKRQLPITLIIGDVNGLKLTNDSFGHIEGDNLLKEIALIIKKATRSEDIISRWGGDEFLVLLPQTSYDDAQKVKNRIIDLQKKSMFDIMTPSISLGIATKTKESESIESKLSDAEKEMYSNKQNDGKKMRSELLYKLEQRMIRIHPELGKHSSNVATKIEEFGSYLQLNKEDLSTIVKLAAYHDIGWVGIDEEILLSPSPLTKQETEKIQIHPEIGFRILKSIPELSYIAELVNSHHEKWDGSGYPEGLKGDKIHYFIRILAIADAFDMMVNNSLYSNKKSMETALAELKELSGKQFDPELVDKFIKMHKKKA